MKYILNTDHLISHFNFTLKKKKKKLKIIIDHLCYFLLLYVHTLEKIKPVGECNNIYEYNNRKKKKLLFFFFFISQKCCG